MTEQEQLTDKLTRLDYPDFEVQPGLEDVLMLRIQGHLICGVGHALSLSDEQLKALIEETVTGG